MSSIAILVPDMAGHLLPTGELGRELRRRGHEVALVAPGKAAALARTMDLPLRELSDDGPPIPPASLIRWLGARLLGVGWAPVIERMLCRKAQRVLEQAPGILRDLRAQCVLVDQDVLAGGTVAERLGLPYATVCSALLWNEEPSVPPHYTGWLPRQGWSARLRNRAGYALWQNHLRRPLETVNRYREAWHLPPLRRFGDTLSRQAQICQMCAELDFPRSRPATWCHYVGSLGAARCGEVAFPWDRLDGRPLVYASLGTMPGGRDTTVYRRIADACAGLDVQLVLGLGEWRERERALADELGQLPGAPVVVGFAPQLALLRRASALITHAGLNTVLEALVHGVPMVAMPRSADQPGVAARVVHARAGLRLPLRSFAAEHLRVAVERLLGDGSFRERAAAMGRALVAAGGPARAADIVERLLETGRPVLRDVPMP